MERSSTTTVGTSFFDALWPAVLEDNVCAIESQSQEYFIPQQRFQQTHWHSFLANVGYSNYLPPQELRCCKAAALQDQSEEEAQQAVNQAVETTTAAKHADYELRGSQAIKPIDQQIIQLRKEQERRQKLAYDFANRKYPWTMQTPKDELGFQLTAELRNKFKKRIEQDILLAIHTYDCKLLLIDAGSEICIDDFPRWIKFRQIIPILVMVRCPRVQRHLQLLEVFQTLLVEENMENTWQEELSSSLKAGQEHALNIKLLKNCSDPIVFVFSKLRGICTCNKFQVVCKL